LLRFSLHSLRPRHRPLAKLPLLVGLPTRAAFGHALLLSFALQCRNIAQARRRSVKLG
jgi:hypothetical protein